ncbi:hypothetical protein BDB00DRAFT_568927 [Zychaea mexicana]|uniref:uncharacterized protein n=1 Tax=Zychaea mexicana TaxID=64656 RepID=UPI0022FF2EC5|nr:uncharacterized protein BDB00DRAFT_568927 [Zychaea mexicana]KAI9490078.1 hypothetical protein BDB00DRAFT_568927 [Zychaea mexicana]
MVCACNKYYGGTFGKEWKIGRLDASWIRKNPSAWVEKEETGCIDHMLDSGRNPSGHFTIIILKNTETQGTGASRGVRSEREWQERQRHLSCSPDLVVTIRSLVSDTCFLDTRENIKKIKTSKSEFNATKADPLPLLLVFFLYFLSFSFPLLNGPVTPHTHTHTHKTLKVDTTA